jgi:hypothetical protein
MVQQEMLGTPRIWNHR